MKRSTGDAGWKYFPLSIKPLFPALKTHLLVHFKALVPLHTYLWVFLNIDFHQTITIAFTNYQRQSQIPSLELVVMLVAGRNSTQYHCGRGEIAALKLSRPVRAFMALEHRYGKYIKTKLHRIWALGSRQMFLFNYQMQSCFTGWLTSRIFTEVVDLYWTSD